jgi:hypothetical protein
VVEIAVIDLAKLKPRRKDFIRLDQPIRCRSLEFNIPIREDSESPAFQITSKIPTVIDGFIDRINARKIGHLDRILGLCR